MSHAAYPTTGDVTAMLVAAGLRSASPTGIATFLDIDGALASAIADWEQDTGLIPFIKDTNDVTVYYDPPGNQGREGYNGGVRGGGRELYLPSQHGSVFSSVTSVTIGYVPNSSVGTVLTLYSDYFLEPRNAALNNRPYDWITFIARSWGFPGSIVVVGKRGWPVVPDNVFKAICRKARAVLAPELSTAKTKGLISWQEGEASMKWGADPFGAIAESDEAAYRMIVPKYMAVTL